MLSDNRPRSRNPVRATATFIRELRDDLSVAPLWQQGLLVAAIALAGLFITMLGLAIAERGDDKATYGLANADAPRHDPSDDLANGEVPPGEPTSVAGVSGPEPNREDCAAIGSGGAFNNTEREWALTNCPELNDEVVFANVTPTPPPSVIGPDPGGPIGLPGPADPTAVPPPANTPTTAPPPGPSFGAGDAIALMIGYYASAPDGHYVISPSTCHATGGSGAWGVSCVGVLKGCARVECTMGLVACVVETTRTVIPGLC